MKIISYEYIEESKSSLYINISLPAHRTIVQYNSLIYNIIDPTLNRFVDKDNKIYWSVNFSKGEYMRITEKERINILEKEYQKIIRTKKIKNIL